MPKKQRILTQMDISKIAIVNDPCNEHALAVLIKNSGDEPGKQAGNPGGSDDQGVNMSVITKALGLPDTATEADIEKGVNDLLKAKDTALADKKAAEDAKAMADAKCAKMVEEAETVEKARLAAAGDESFTNIDGAVITKSATPGSYDMLKSMNDRLVLADVTQRATTEFPNIAKSAPTPVLLKIAKRLGGEDGKAIEEVLKAHNAAVGLALVKKGHSGGDEADLNTADPEDEIDKMAKAHQAANAGISYAQAYDAVIQTRAGQDLVIKSRQQ